jgi:hypothetical protein
MNKSLKNENKFYKDFAHFMPFNKGFDTLTWNSKTPYFESFRFNFFKYQSNLPIIPAAFFLQANGKQPQKRLRHSACWNGSNGCLASSREETV